MGTFSDSDVLTPNEYHYLASFYGNRGGSGIKEPDLLGEPYDS